MGRARRQLPLYEVLSSSPRRTGAGRPVPVRHDAAGAAPALPVEAKPAEAKPVEVKGDEASIALAPPSTPEPEIKPVAREPFRRKHAPASAAAATSAPASTTPQQADGEMIDGSLRLPASTLLILLAVVIAVVAVAWTIAFRMGAQTEAAKMGEQFPDAPSPDRLVSGPGDGRTGGSPSPDGNPGSAQPPSPAPQPKPAMPTPAAAGGDPRIPGSNYLYLGTLTERDATAGVTFLTQNGVPAFYVVDRSKGGANNPPCRIYAAEGVPSDRYRDSQRERDELVRKVEEIGRRWQRDHKGASDFRQPYWTLHKG